MEGSGGWQPPPSAHRWLAMAAALALVAWTMALLPGGCQSGPSASRTPGLPQSPLERARAAGVVEPPSMAERTPPARPMPPLERPMIPSTEPVIRVRVAADATEPFVLSHPSGWLWLKPTDQAQGRTVRSPVRIEATPSGWRVAESASSSRRIDLSGGAALEVHPPNGDDDEIQWRGGSWPGQATLVRRDRGVDLVFAVPIETYLPGVLAKELYKGWHPAAYRAQAIAARSYAMCEKAWWEGRRHYDVVAGQASQAWIGATADATSREAVENTRGEYLVFGGRVVPAYYSSCCGGAAASATDAIRDGSWMDIDPLRVVDQRSRRRSGCCEKAPTASWKVTMKADEFTRRLNAWAGDNGRKDLPQLGTVRSISVAESNPAGRPVLFRLRDGRGRTALWASEDLRYAVNAGSNGRGDSLKSGYLDPRVGGGMVTLQGRGHGHGTGMCQYGAQAMAVAGKDHDAILRRYYPGAAVKVSSSGPSAESLVSDARD
jgi:stage II sporulation protein D